MIHSNFSFYHKICISLEQNQKMVFQKDNFDKNNSTDPKMVWKEDMNFHFLKL